MVDQHIDPRILAASAIVIAAIVLLAPRGVYYLARGFKIAPVSDAKIFKLRLIAGVAICYFALVLLFTFI